ncbi:MAG: hypothetical protein M3R68_00050 [Acidobacteriota bacterium]|nr:hypothetical protein [Acidobacteriota bacterium]
MKFHWQISAGEFFELLRPLALVISALLSTWVLASARRWHFHLTAALAWAIGTFFFPFIVFPIYLIARGWTKRGTRSQNPEEDAAVALGSAAPLRFRNELPAVYGLVLLALIGLYIYRDYRTVDAHLARAAQAKVMNQQARAIREYRAALAIEDNPHTHKLLGIELAEMKDWFEALREFRAAESGGEPDESLPFSIALALEATGQTNAAQAEFKTYLSSHACTQIQPDSRCETARDRASATR